MKRICIILQILIFFPFLLFSQVNYKKAIFVNLNGDTIQGFIKDLNWMTNPDKFMFKKYIEADNRENIDINNASCVILNGNDVYNKFVVSISQDEIKSSLLNTGPDTSKIVKTVFLKTLVEGCNSNLYSYTDEKKTRYFCSDQNFPEPVELRYRTYYSADNLGIITDKFYQKQLEYLAKIHSSGSKELINKIRSTPYRSNELIEIFSIINGGNNSICQKMVIKNKTIYQLYASLGFRKSSLNYMQYTGCHELSSNSVKNPSYSPHFGVGLKINSPGSRINFREELGFSTDKMATNDHFAEPLNDLYEDFSYSLSQYNFTLSNMIVYDRLITNKIRWYLGVGLNINYSKITKSKYSSEIKESYNSYIKEIEPLLDPSRIWFSFPIKIGLTLNDRIELNSSYYLPVTQNNDTQLNIWEIGLTYYF